MNKLFIGRFQPFHNGHFSVIKDIIINMNKENVLYIGIGSTEANYLPENPFTIAERFTMIDQSLQEAKINANLYRIIPVPNINNYAMWPRQVELFIPYFDEIYTGSSIVEKLFEDYNKSLKKPYKIISVKKVANISATHIRSQIIENKQWENLVPQKVAELIKQWDAIERIKKI